MRGEQMTALAAGLLFVVAVTMPIWLGLLIWRLL